MIYLLVSLVSLAFPLVIIFGFILLLSFFFGGKNNKKETPNATIENGSLTEIIADLESIKAKKTSLTAVLQKYKDKLAAQANSFRPTIPGPPVLSNEAAPIETTQVVPQTIEAKEELPSQIENWWENWYEENNINLLLYIGAFLIVSSAAIFVGFNWESFTGVFKAFVLSLLTICFFLSGFYFFFQTPKLKNAGSTFLAIGSLLIPFNGLAWYNFALRDSGISFGSVWFTTSIVAALVYFSLAILIKNRFYTYIAGLGTLSLIEALVNISSLNARFYILGGIFSAFTLLAGSKVIAATKKEEFDRIYSEPLNISSQITMPIFLIWGLMLASTQGALFTYEATLSAFLASLFYLLAFSIQRNMTFIVLTELLLAMSLVLFMRTIGFSGIPVYIGIFALCLLFEMLAYYFQKIHKSEESYYTVFTASFITLLAIPFTFVDRLIEPLEIVYLVLIGGFINALSALIQKQANYLYFAIGAVNLAGFVYVNSVVERSDWFGYLGLAYFVFGIILVFCNLYANQVSLAWKQVLAYSSYLNLALAVLFNLNSAENILIISIATLAVGVVVKYLKKESDPVFSPVTASGLGILGLCVSFALPEYSSLDQVYFGIVLACIGFLSAYVERKPEYLYVGFAAIDVAALIKIQDSDFGRNTFNYLTLAYLALGVLQYTAATFLWLKLQKWILPFLIFTAINLTLAFGFSLNSETFSLLVSAIIAFLGLLSVYVFKKEELGFLGISFVCISAVNVFRVLDIPSEFYPIAFTTLSYTLYLVSIAAIPALFQRVLKYSSLIIAVGNPIAFGFYSQNTRDYSYYDGYQYRYVSQESNLELYSLISAYLSTILLSIEAYRTRLIQLGYFASIAGLITVLWQYKFLEFDEVQIYSITTAVYLLTIAYTRQKLGKPDERQLLEYAGLAILFLPSLFQAIPESGFWYAILLGFEGLMLLFAGLSTNYKLYIYSGVAALAVATLTRVYSFIASLGSWAIIGSLGLVFLATAIYLLNKRKLE